MATHSSILAWRIPGTGKPIELLSAGSHGVAHNWRDLAAAAETPTSVFGSWLMKPSAAWQSWLTSSSYLLIPPIFILFFMHAKSLQTCLTLCAPMDCRPPGSSVHGDSPGQNTGVGSLSLLQGIFPTQGSNPGFPDWRWILYQLSHKKSPRILEWVPYPFSSGSSLPRNEPGLSPLWVDSLPTELSEKLQNGKWSIYFL